ncbi:glycoside hydrolase family 88 protein [Flammeovirgaceae bacterium SG7u.111]|nr:glycoside hydrolase family 88 protein [Flammeovirgaceae bacterium SG7u.132]WPO38102.1 glycoside hydrolase family 88 protein [Flammeovirgaceae bacterium SG7u.111]
MKMLFRKSIILLFIFGALSCEQKKEEAQEVAPPAETWQFSIDGAFAQAEEQLLLAVKNYPDPTLFPRTNEKDGKVQLVKWNDWTSGFFPGTLWLSYEQSNNEALKAEAEKRTEALEENQHNDRTHDTGFMVYCSYGEGLRVAGKEDYKPVMIQTAKTLSTRFDPTVGCIKSWDWGAREGWEYPVIVDNMMNLELLYWAAKETGDTTFSHIATTHALTTMANHYREDMSCYHVIDYYPEDGSVRNRNTHQGFSDDSAWARGQAWGLYGFTLCYEETGDERFLEHAKKIAAYLMNHPRMPEDKVPYWDFDAPDIPNAPRDASAGALIASALINLSTLVEDTSSKVYFDFAKDIVKSLASPEYAAEPGTNNFFLLKHSTGNLPGDKEIDVPLNYADYYYLEALHRLKKAM